MTQSSMTGTGYTTQIQRLLAGYFSMFPNEQERLEVLAQQVETGMDDLCDRRTLPGHLTGAALVLQAQTSGYCVLLIHHRFLQRWLQPGGHLEKNEYPVDGARRELDEEVGAGLQVSLHDWHRKSGIPLDIDSHVIPLNDRKNEPQHLHHDWMYVFQAQTSADLTLQESEVSAFSWVPLEELGTGKYGARLQRACEKLLALGLCQAAKRDRDER
jgi:8-oxo-dGTP pyrophosphatase MutT (NUDIX family)